MIPSYEISGGITALVKRVFRKRYPYQPDNNVTFRDLQNFAPKALRWETGILSATFLFLFLLITIYTFLFYHLYLLLYNIATSPPDIFFHAGWACFFMPGFLLALSNMGPVYKVVQRSLLGKRYSIYKEYQNNKEQYDVEKGNTAFGNFFVIPFAVALILVNTATMTVTPTVLKYKYVFALHSHTQSYSDIKEIKYFLRHEYKGGNQKYAPHYKIIFKDHTDFQTDFYFEEVEDAVPFINLLVNKGIKCDTFLLDKFVSVF